MNLARSLRQWICKLMVGVILLAQMSIAAYACPKVSAPAAMSMDMVGCEQMAGPMDKAFPNLCAEHCHQGHQSDMTQVPSVPAIALISLYTVAQATVDQAPSRPWLPDHVPLAAPPPPLSILHCCFRI